MLYNVNHHNSTHNKEIFMYANNTTFKQILQVVRSQGFDSVVQKHNSDKRYQNFTAYNQFAAMVFAQLTDQIGLRGIENSLAAQKDLYHAGVNGNIKRTNLAHVNDRRDCAVWEDLYYHLLNHYYQLKGKKENENTRILKNIDATVLTFSKNKFPWASYKSTKTGVKIHTRMDISKNCADYLFITNVNRHENNTLEQMCDSGCINVCDRGDFNIRSFVNLDNEKKYFVTRMKSGALYDYTLGARRRGIENDKYVILMDEDICFTGKKLSSEVRKRKFRLIESMEKDSASRIMILTNVWDMNAIEIAEIYHRRWQIEVFFKLLKQNLHIKKVLWQK